MMNHINRMAAGTAGLLAILLAGLVAALLVDSAPKQLFFLILWTWALIAACLLIRKTVGGEDLLTGAMYVFLAATFLNQSLLSLPAGFFTLFIYRIMMLVCLMILFALALRRRGLANLWQGVEVKGILYFFLFWMAYGAVSLLWARSVIDGIRYLFLIDTGIAFVFLSVFAFQSMRRLSAVFRIWMVMSGCLILIGLINHFAKIQLPTSTLYGGPAYKLGYPTAVFTNQNDFATLLAISVFFYLACARNVKNRGIRGLAAGAAVLSVYSIWLTDSRASLLAVTAGMAFYVFLLLPQKLKKIGVTAGLLLLAAGLGYATLHDGLPGHLAMEEPQDPVNAAPSSNRVRMNLLRSTVSYLADSWGFGVGAGNLPVYLEYQPRYPTGQIYEVHNWLAEIAGNFGIFIAAGYLAVYAALFFGLYRNSRGLSGAEPRMLAEGAMTAMIAFLISSISPSSVSNLYFHWTFLGFIVALVSVLQKKRFSEKKIRGQEGCL